MLTEIIERPGVRVRRVQAVINPRSGGVGPATADKLGALLARLGLEHRVCEVGPGELEPAMREAIDAGPDVLVVLGGDGTARLAAELAGPQGPLVAPLSAGTMSKLGRALYGATPWREALAQALTGGTARWMSAGEVDGHTFYCRAVLGPPALFVRAREAVRARRLGRAWRRAVIASRQAFQARLAYDFDGERGEGLCIGLICPTLSRALDDDEGALEAALLDLRDAKAGLRLALNDLIGDWRDDPDVTARPCVHGRVWARGPIPAMLDGEFFRLGREVQVRFRPRAFRALGLGAE